MSSNCNLSRKCSLSLSLQAASSFRPVEAVMVRRGSSSCCWRLRTHGLRRPKELIHTQMQNLSSTQVKSLLLCFLLCVLFMTCSDTLRLAGFCVWCAAMLPLLVVHVQLASWVGLAEPNSWEILEGRQVVHSCSDTLLTPLGPISHPRIAWLCSLHCKSDVVYTIVTIVQQRDGGCTSARF